MSITGQQHVVNTYGHGNETTYEDVIQMQIW